MRLHTLPLITAANKIAQLSKDDLAFIEARYILLSKAHDVAAVQFLLGCDQLWRLLDIPLSRYTLPSGLHLIPSKLGYLLTESRLQMSGSTSLRWKLKSVRDCSAYLSQQLHQLRS